MLVLVFLFALCTSIVHLLVVSGCLLLRACRLRQKHTQLQLLYFFSGGPAINSVHTFIYDKSTGRAWRPYIVAGVIQMAVSTVAFFFPVAVIREAHKSRSSEPESTRGEGRGTYSTSRKKTFRRVALNRVFVLKEDPDSYHGITKCWCHALARTKVARRCRSNAVSMTYSSQNLVLDVLLLFFVAFFFVFTIPFSLARLCRGCEKHLKRKPVFFCLWSLGAPWVR